MTPILAVEVEQQVIGSMIFNPNALIAGFENLNQEDFFDHKNKIIFQVLSDLQREKKKVDLIVLKNEIKRRNLEYDTGGIDYLTTVGDYDFNSNQIESHIQILKEKSLRRKLIGSVQSVIGRCQDETTDINELSKEVLSSISSLVETKTGLIAYDHQQSLSKYVDYLSRGMEGTGLKGFSSHLPDLDNVINGFQKRKSYIIGGLKKTGKSRFVLNLTSGLLIEKLSGVFFSMEMEENDIHNCILACRTDVDTSHMGTSRLTQEEFSKLMEECNSYSMEKLYIDRKSAISPEHVINKIKLIKQKKAVDFVVIDYIQRMRTKAENRVKEMELCATRLADIAREEDLIMIVLSQLSGEAEKKTGHAPIYSYIKDSQAILEAADCAIILDDPNRGKPMEERFKDINAIVIQREGVSDYWVKLQARLQFSKFNCISKR